MLNKDTSCMEVVRIDLLLNQVLSSSVSLAFTFMKKDEFTETARFCRMFDKFFDCLNTRRIGEGKEERKPDLEPYWSDKDVRFTVSSMDILILLACKAIMVQWLEETFLGYLKEWKESVNARTGFDKKAKAKMMISHETIEGLKMSG